MSKLQSKTNYIIVEILRSKFKYDNQQRAITSKVWCLELWILFTALLPNDIYLPMKIHVNALHSFKVMLRTKFKNENKQRTITPQVWCLELWFLSTALFLNEIYLAMKFHVNALPSFKVMLRTKIKNENEQRAITPKVWCLELWFLCTALLFNKIFLPMKFHFNVLPCLKVMLRTKFKNENKQRAITPKVWWLELWFLSTALFLNEIYLAMKFHVNALPSFKVMLRTKIKNENE